MATKKTKSRTATTPEFGVDLVIVESPAKAKTINKYLGSSYKVLASVGHIRDLPKRAPKGVKQPVPGVDLSNKFEPTYVVMEGKTKTVAELRKAAKSAKCVWFATDLDREGEAIAWHLAEVLGIDPVHAKRVVFNAITKDEILHAFENPRAIDLNKVNAQQARRIIDRIVGYLVSPFLWKKVAGGLSAGRVQSVAVRLVVDRERLILAHIPSESWKVHVELTPELEAAVALSQQWREFRAGRDEKGKGPTQRQQEEWLGERECFDAELVELGGKPFELGCASDAPADLTKSAAKVAEAVGLESVSAKRTAVRSGKGPAAHSAQVTGVLAKGVRYKTASIERKRETSRPYPPFITSTLQRAGVRLGFTSDRSMRVAQALYETGWITYHRTDSTSISGAGLAMVRTFIEQEHGARYLPASPRQYTSSNKSAQEAHEAVRPTDCTRTSTDGRNSLPEDQAKLYELIWRCFVASQMTDAEFDRATVRLERSDLATGAVLRASGRTLVFDGFLKVNPRGGDDAIRLPSLKQGQETAPIGIAVEQVFSSPPSRFSEGSLVKTLEEEGIGRPSTYAAIIKTIVEREYVERKGSTLLATDLGMVVTDILVEAFPHVLDIGFTRRMEGELDSVEEKHFDWHEMVADFYGPFKEDLDHAAETTTHAKAVTTPAPYACPKCGARTVYRFGRAGRFLSCGAYPECKYASPVSREGEPMLPVKVDLRCPIDGAPMILRTGRFGQFLTSENALTEFIMNVDKKGRLKFPAPPPVLTEIPCPKCDKPMNLRQGLRGPWLGCSGFPKCRGREAWTKLDEALRAKLLKSLDAELVAHKPLEISRLDGIAVMAGTPLVELLLEGGVQTLALYVDAAATE